MTFKESSPTLPHEIIIFEANAFKTSCDKRIGLLTGREVKYSIAEDFAWIQTTQEQATVLLKKITDLNTSDLSNRHASLLNQAKENLTEIFQRSTETLLHHRFNKLTERAVELERLPLSELKDVYLACLEFAKDFDVAMTSFQSQGSIPPGMLALSKIVPSALNYIETLYSSKKKELHQRAFEESRLSPESLVTEEEEKATTGYIKGGEKLQRSKITQVCGPLNRSQATKDLNEILGVLLENMNAVAFTKDAAGVIWATYNGKKCNFSIIQANANFNHLTFTPSQLEQYHKLLESSTMMFIPLTPDAGPATREFFDRQNTEGMYDTLSLAEKEAINIYTGNGCKLMHATLNGDSKAILEEHKKATKTTLTDDQRLDIGLKEGLLHAAVCVSGLNKLPNYTPPPRPDGTIPKYLYRAQEADPSVVSKREHLMNQGRMTTVFQLMSTSYGYATFQYAGGIYTLIRNVKGKLIQNLSQHPSEQEVLLPPTQLQFLYHRHDPESGTHFYIARPITSPTSSD